MKSRVPSFSLKRPSSPRRLLFDTCQIELSMLFYSINALMQVPPPLFNRITTLSPPWPLSALRLGISPVSPCVSPHLPWTSLLGCSAPRCCDCGAHTRTGSGRPQYCPRPCCCSRPASRCTSSSPPHGLSGWRPCCCWAPLLVCTLRSHSARRTGRYLHLVPAPPRTSPASPCICPLYRPGHRPRRDCALGRGG